MDVVGAIVAMGGILMGALLYRLYLRVEILEGVVRNNDAAMDLAMGTSVVCSENTKAIERLVSVVNQHGDEIAVMREVSNENQSAILSAVVAQSEATVDAIRRSFVPRDVLQAQIADLYKRTESKAFDDEDA